MFDLGWTELLLIGIVALIVVGPKDLPMLFRKVGQFVGKARGMAREFSRAMNDAADESGVKDVTNTFKAASQPFQTSVDSVRKAASDFSTLDLESDMAALDAEHNDVAQKTKKAASKKEKEAIGTADTKTQKSGSKKSNATGVKAASKKTTTKKVTSKSTGQKPAAKKSFSKSSSKKLATKAAPEDKA